VALFAGLALSKLRRRALVALVPALALPTLLLGLAEDRSGDRYYEILRLGGASKDTVHAVARRMGELLVKGASVAPRVLDTPMLPQDVLPAGLVVVLLALGLRSPKLRGKVSLWLLLATLTLGATLLTGSAWWPHHLLFTLAFLLPPLALVLERGMGTAGRRILLVFLGLYWVLLLPRLSASAAADESNLAKDRLLAFIRESGLSRTTVQVHTSWGTFYIAHLFGDPAQEVLYYRFREWTESPLHLREARDLAESQGRGILVLTSRSEAMTDTPLIEGVLGAPVRRFLFGNWEALEYLR